MTLRESQDSFMAEMGLFDEWPDKFNLLIEYSNQQPGEAPGVLSPFRLGNCQSRTYFRADNIDGRIHITGWSNSSIMAGLIICFKKIFNDIPVRELRETPVDFHTGSGLIDHVTFQRKMAILEMIGRVNVLYADKL